MATMSPNLASLTDAQARNLVIRALRTSRQYYRTADTLGEKFEREVDRLIKRKTRINATSLVGLSKRYKEWLDAVTRAQKPLGDAYDAAAQF